MGLRANFFDRVSGSSGGCRHMGGGCGNEDGGRNTPTLQLLAVRTATVGEIRPPYSRLMRILRFRIMCNLSETRGA